MLHRCFEVDDERRGNAWGRHVTAQPTCPQLGLAATVSPPNTAIKTVDDDAVPLSRHPTWSVHYP